MAEDRAVYETLAKYNIQRAARESPLQRQQFYEGAVKVLELILAEESGAQGVLSYKELAEQYMLSTQDRFRILRGAYEKRLEPANVLKEDMIIMEEYKKVRGEHPDVRISSPFNPDEKFRDAAALIDVLRIHLKAR